MQTKRIAGTLLLVFAAASVVAVAVKERENKAPGSRKTAAPSRAVAASPSDPSDPSDRTSPAASRHVIAYYFHGSFRCPTCNAIERLSKETIESEFEDECAEGILEFREVNIEEPGNEHYAKDYQLYAQSLVLVEYADGEQTRWENLKRVWELVHDEPTFREYVREGIRAFLKGEAS